MKDAWEQAGEPGLFRTQCFKNPFNITVNHTEAFCLIIVFAPVEQSLSSLVTETDKRPDTFSCLA